MVKLGEKPFYKYCPFCASPLVVEERGGRLRPVCKACGFVQYLNPTVGVAVIVLDGDRILLGKRAREPGKGRWCIPCGHVEWGEDVRDAAVREFEEETGLKVELEAVFDVLSNFHNPEHLTVGVWFMGRVVGGKLSAGDDLSDVGFFSVFGPEVELAFPTDEMVIGKLRRLFKKRF